MFALAAGGTPTVSLLGTNLNNLTWVVNQPLNTTMMLNVVDANGTSGGGSPDLFTVTAGPNDCIDPKLNLDPDFTVTANVSGTIETCQPWGLRVVGGVPPYNLTMSELKSPVITNVTMPNGDDVFTYINRADPDLQLIAAISDFTGRWAMGTPMVHTHGSSNVDCIGLGSVSSNSNTSNAQVESSLNGAGAHTAPRLFLQVLAFLGGLVLVSMVGSGI